MSLALATVARSARADRCARVRLVEMTPVSGEWSAPVEALRADLADLGPAECVDATLAIETRGDELHLALVAVDGRRIERDVAKPSLLRPLALSLFARDGDPPPPAKPDEPVAVLPPTAPTPPRVDPPPPPTPRRVFPAFRLSIGARYTGPTESIVGEASLGVDAIIHGWMVGVGGRFATLGVRTGLPDVSGWVHQELAIGLVAGRRFDFGRSSIEVAVAPQFAYVTLRGDAQGTGSVGGNGNGNGGGSLAQLRLGVIGRVLLPFAGTVRPEIGVDVEIAPLDVAAPRQVDADLPPIPSWTVGGSLGVRWDLR